MSGVREQIGFLFSDDAYWTRIDPTESDGALEDLIHDVCHLSGERFSGDVLIRLFEDERARLQGETKSVGDSLRNEIEGMLGAPMEEKVDGR